MKYTRKDIEQIIKRLETANNISIPEIWVLENTDRCCAYIQYNGLTGMRYCVIEIGTDFLKTVETTDALAMIIGHEYTHTQQEKINNTLYNEGFSHNTEYYLSLETEADINGCKIAQKAGYNAEEGFKHLLKILDTENPAFVGRLHLVSYHLKFGEVYDAGL